MNDKSVRIPYSVYQNLINHLVSHASSDGWAKQCIEQLDNQAVVVTHQPIPPKKVLNQSLHN